MNELMLRRRNLLAKSEQGGGDLPIIFDALVGDGTAYIDTDNFNSSYTYEIDFSNAPNYKHIFGTRKAYSSGYYVFAKQSSTNGQIYLGGNSAKTFTLSNARHKISINWSKGNAVLDNTTEIQFTSSGDNISGGAVRIFGSSGYSETITALRVFEFKIYDNADVLIRHLKPCTYNGESGMWDFVSNTFVGNSSSSGGTFSVVNI